MKVTMYTFLKGYEILKNSSQKKKFTSIGQIITKLINKKFKLKLFFEIY